MKSPNGPDALFDYASFRMRIPMVGDAKETTVSFDQTTKPTVQKQQIAHECCHVLQALRYPIFGNYANYYWKRSKALVDALLENPQSTKFTFAEGWDRFAAANGEIGSLILHQVAIQDRYDLEQFRELNTDKAPTSLFSLLEAMAISFQAVATQSLPEVFFKDLPSDYTRSHDMISETHLMTFDLRDHFVFVAAFHPFFVSIDYGDECRSRMVGSIMEAWPRLRETYDFFVQHETATRADFQDCILDFCDDLVMSSKDTSKMKDQIYSLDKATLARFAAGMGIVTYVVTELLGSKGRVGTRVRHTPLSANVMYHLDSIGCALDIDFFIPLLLACPNKASEAINAILETTLEAKSLNHDVALIGAFAINTIEAVDGAEFECCADHGLRSWSDVLNCSSESSVSASLRRLELPNANTLFRRIAKP